MLTEEIDQAELLLARKLASQSGFDEAELDALTVYEAVGCGSCSGGYKGRVGIYQVMPISQKMEKLVMENGNALELAKLAQEEKINDLRQSALDKVRQGVTTIAEVERVTKD